VGVWPALPPNAGRQRRGLCLTLASTIYACPIHVPGNIPIQTVTAASTPAKPVARSDSVFTTISMVRPTRSFRVRTQAVRQSGGNGECHVYTKLAITLNAG
jgi:hypothetical protein